MKKIAAYVFGLFFLVSSAGASEMTIPEFAQIKKIPNVAQYKLADWSGVVDVARGITLEEAKWRALENPEITFFFYTTGLQMVLEYPEGYRIFQHGDAVFFKGEPWWGEAIGLADGYIKKEYSSVN